MPGKPVKPNNRCALSFAKSENSQQFDIKVVSSKISNAKISKVRVLEKDGKLFLTGNVNRKNRYQPVALGHIDVSVIGADGNILMESASNYSPKRVHKETKKRSHFKFELANLPPQGSAINVAYHKDASVHHVTVQHDINVAK